MGRLFWPAVVVIAFCLGWAAAGAGSRVRGTSDTTQLQDTVNRLQQQVNTLQAQLRARESARTSGYGGTPAAPSGSYASPSTQEDRLANAATVEERLFMESLARGGDAAFAPRSPRTAVAPSTMVASTPSTGAAAPGSPVARPAPTVEAALERFYRYLEATTGPEGRERGQRMREMVSELRGMGDAGVQALMHVLASGTDSDERRAAARLLGTLQAPQALPLLKDIIEKEDDILLRRAAAAGLRQLQTAESMPVMERMLGNAAEDRFVRLSAALGLAESGRPIGVTGLAHIFDESAADGRGREMAFRALVSLRDERPLPFMRQLVTAQAEPSYRLQAIRYLTTQGDRTALPALQIVANNPREQASVRDAAAQAVTAIGGR
jgi:hypothetical protein